jgi:dimethylaniline monooxygenase (N-oxide forming)
MPHDARPAACVIGGGVAGLASAKVLLQDGFAVTLFERESTTGGVWSESRTYPGLRANNPRETYAFSDFPFPPGVDEFPTAEQIRTWLDAYIDHFGIRPVVRTSTEVVSVARNTDEHAPGKRFRVVVRSDGARPEPRHFDFVVVCNGVFSLPFVPPVQGRERFAGAVLHSSQLTTPEIMRGRRVIIVGAGKSALDCAALAAREAAAATLVFRSAHWMLPRYIFSRVRMDRVFVTRAAEMLLPRYHRPTRAETLLHGPCAPLLRLWWQAQSRLILRLCRTPPALVPDTPLPSGLESSGVGTEFFEVLAEGRLESRRATITAFSGGHAVTLDTGETLEADVVVFATGWRQDVSFLEPDLRDEVCREGRFHLYRHILPPGEPRLGLVGYASSIACPFTSEMAAHWLSQCFRGDLTLPDRDAMEREIARVHEWLGDVLPARPEGYFIGAYIAHYIDDLLRDMGLPVRRTRSVLREYFAPLWPERYHSVARERQARRAATPAFPIGFGPH